jgi:hypothetical protein
MTSSDPGAGNISGSNVPSPATTVTTQPAAYQLQQQFQAYQRIATQLQPNLARQRNVQAIADNFTSRVTKEWVPCIFSPAQVQQYLLDTRRQIEKIQRLEAEQNKLLPTRSRQLEETIFMARLDFKIRFGRIFRINDLPPEVLTVIFRYVLWSTPYLNTRWRLWVTWVCRHWREIAVSDPILWNAISFENPNFERSFAWFERSADSSLDIRIIDTKEKPMSLETMQNLLKRLLEKISNFRIILIVLQDWDPILFLLHAFCVVKEKNLPMIIERFEMHRGGSPYVQIGAGHENRFYLQPIPLFGGATVPSFNHLTLNGIHIDWANSVLTNLTYIDIRRIPLDKSPTLTQFRELIGGSPALQHLHLDGAGPSLSEEIRGMKPVHIPSLKGLILADFSLKYALYVCSQISTPNVLGLAMKNFVGEDYCRLYDILRSSMPLIKLLKLYNILFVPNAQSAISVIRWLESMPQLTYFCIGDMIPEYLELFLYDYKTMKSLTDGQTPSANIPCPNLVFLETDALHIDAIIRWAHIRKHLGCPLRKIFFPKSFEANMIGQEQYRQLAAALDNGGTIQILSPGIRPVEEWECMAD